MDWEQIYLRLTSDHNDATAWAVLKRRVQVWARAAFYCHRHHVIEDAVVDTCAAIAVNLAAARGPETFAAFAYGHFLNVRRRIRRSWLPGSVPIENIDVPSPGADDDDIDADASSHVRRALAALPARKRKAVMLRYFDELPSARIAAELGVTNGNARQILWKGLRRMRRTHLAGPGPARRGNSGPQVDSASRPAERQQPLRAAA